MITLLIAMSALGLQDWETLFNGKDLTGWKANRDPEAFTVQDGILKAHATSPLRSHLFFTGDKKEGYEKFKNFELEAVVRAEPDSNSGIFIHTDDRVRDKFHHLATGYEIQLNNSERDKKKTGSLYAVVDLDKSPVDESKWFTVKIVVEGKRIRVSIDGNLVVDYTEPEDVKRPPERAGRLLSAEGGAIALQAHDDKSTWYFKQIRVRRLP